MGNGMCSRKQKRILQSLLLLAVLVGCVYGAVLYYELQDQLRKAEAVAVKYQQHQESLSAQLQVVYEHRSRLEKSLQKERLEHKKAKEDFLVYKLEAQETLNKGRQDSSSKYNALNVQHQMLKSQHEELKKLHTDLEDEHRKQGEDFSRAVNDHKQRYLEMQQEKGQELSKLKESLYNMREENRQLRKAYQDIHTQLQDVKLQHKNLLSQHDQLLVTLEEHKRALDAAQSFLIDHTQTRSAVVWMVHTSEPPAQSQVEEYRQLKETLKKMPSFQRSESSHQSPVAQGTPAPSLSSNSRVHNNVAEQQNEVTPNGEHPQEGEGIHVKEREDRAIPFHPGGNVIEGHPHRELNIQQKQEAGDDKEQHLEQVEEERKKELEEEEMEQAGQPENLAEDLEQTPEGHEWKEKDEETNILHEHAHLEKPAATKTITRYKSAYEEQLEQQRLAAQRAEEASRLRERQESLHQERLQEQLLRQQQLKEKELSLRRQAEQDEEQFKHHLSQQSHYDNLDQDIVQGEEQGAQEEDENYEQHNPHPQEAEEGDPNRANEQHNQDANHQAESEQNEDTRKAAVDDVNPADDPNNQGEDEFEEAEQEREEALPEEEKQLKPHEQVQVNNEVGEHLVMVGNPDQQEDNVDEQYQEEGEEEAQGDLTEEKKRVLEHNGEEPYGENDENAEEKMSEGADQEQDLQEEANPKEGRDENYEEEEEEEEGGAVAAKAHRRGEM